MIFKVIEIIFLILGIITIMGADIFIFILLKDLLDMWKEGK